jgi:D-alanyl-D-alanine-carboxypeptidase/D-alanyl-D-alanine-endopeptidase
LDGQRLMIQPTWQNRLELHPETETEFFLEEVDAQITFVVGPDGKASELVLHQGGRDMLARRKQ